MSDQDKKHESKTRKAYRDALARLRAGIQTHPKLKGRKVRITPTSVALEARKSRNPLYTTHRDILKEIQDAASQPADKPRAATAEDKIAELREVVRKLKEDNRKLASENATLLYRVTVAEQKLVQKDKEIGELLKTLEHTPVLINKPRKGK